jgi:hypothetical protein
LAQIVQSREQATEDCVRFGVIYMSVLAIPEEHYEGFESLMRLNDDLKAQLISALGNIKPTSRVRDFTTQLLTQVPKIPDTEIKCIVPVIISIYRLMERRAVDINTLVAELMEAIQEAEELDIPANWQPERFAEYLQQILSVNGSVSIIAKATGVFLDHERIYCGARILTDIRPVFSSDAAVMPNAAVIVHTLKIGYHENGDHKEFYLALDAEDIRKLQEILNRANTKAQSLKELLNKAELSYLPTERQE